MKQTGGLAWLNGKRWSEITRDERFFCAHLYKKVLEDGDGIVRLVRTINNVCGLNLPLNESWEFGFEVVFYRDMYFHNPQKFERKASNKRTFDLCLFSNNHIIIIEAKAFQSFDRSQVNDFLKDKVYIEETLKFPVEVLLIPLASSLYKAFEISELAKEFDSNGKLLTWKILAEEYGKDRILQSANNVFGRKPKPTGENEAFLEGQTLMELYHSHTLDPQAFWVGRGQGLKGLKEDLENNEWQERPYQTNSSQSSAPNRNWFSLEAFAKTVGGVL